MADGVTDSSHWGDVAGVASTLLGAAAHRKRASADPATHHIHLHRRSSSLVSDLTIDGINDADDCCFKCPRVLERFCCSPDHHHHHVTNQVCCSPDGLCSPTGTTLLQPPSTPSTCGSQPAALQHQPDSSKAAALPPSPVLKGAASGMRLQLTQLPQPWQRQPPRSSRRSCPGALSMASPRSPAVAAAAGTGRLALPDMHPPASPGMLSSSHSCCSPAAAAGAAPLPMQLNSLMLVASQLAGNANGSSRATAGAPGDSCSPLLPATQASLNATTASVVASELAAAAAAEAGQFEHQQQQKLVELPSWLRSGSSGLAASAAICRASLLSTTAALARLNQQQPPGTGHAQHPMQQQQQQPGHACMVGAQPDAAMAQPCALELQQAGVQGVGGSVALGVPVTGGIVTGMPVHCQQQQLEATAAAAGCGASGRLFDFKAAGACTVGQLCVSSLRLPVPTCGDQLLMEASMQCDDATSCCSTPRSGLAAAGALPSEDVRQVADAAARLLLSSSSGSRRRRCCWEAEAMEEEHLGDAMESDGESADITSAAAGKGEVLVQQAACAQQLAMAVGDAAACAVVVVVDVAAKRSSGSSKAEQQPVVVAVPAVSAGLFGESP